jgi:hypothetical protein
MKRELALRSSLVIAIALAGSPALAQQPKPSAPPDKETGYSYVFIDDPLAAGDFSPNDVQIRVVRHAMRTTLIRLRTDFVAQMLVSVEKL